jgi:hypothetical protein
MTGYGYAALLLPDNQVWRGFNLSPLDGTDGLVQLIRTLTPNVIKRTIIDRSAPLSKHDVACISVLAAMMAQSAFGFDIVYLALPAAAIARISGLDYYWVEVWDTGSTVDTNLGPLDLNSVEEAILVTARLGFEKGLSPYPD